METNTYSINNPFPGTYNYKTILLSQIEENCMRKINADESESEVLGKKLFEYQNCVNKFGNVLGFRLEFLERKI